MICRGPGFFRGRMIWLFLHTGENTKLQISPRIFVKIRNGPNRNPGQGPPVLSERAGLLQNRTLCAGGRSGRRPGRMSLLGTVSVAVKIRNGPNRIPRAGAKGWVTKFSVRLPLRPPWSVLVIPESTEGFTEDQAFSTSSGLAPPHPINKFSLFISLPVCRRVELTDGREVGYRNLGVGEKPNHTTARKPDPL